MNDNTKTLNSQYELIPLGIIVAVIAILCRLPALGSWWSLDDWNLLARGANVLFADGPSPRVFSQVVWWKFFYPIFGDNAQAWAFLRLLVFGGIGWTTVDICKHLNMTRMAQLVAGLLVAASPLAFTPLYWASGIQTLLGALFALLAIVFALKNKIWLVLLFGILSILSKENAILLPLFLPFVFRNKTWKHWIAIGFLTLSALLEGWAVFSTFNHSPDMPYALGNIQSILIHLAGYSWWGLSVGVPYNIELGIVELIAGFSVWILWGLYSYRTYQAGDSVPSILLLASLLSIAPALSLKTHHYPYMAFLAAVPGYILVAQLIAKRVSFSLRKLVVISTVMFVVGFGLMEARISLRDADGLPADTTVRNSSISWAAHQSIRAFPDNHVAILQPKISLNRNNSGKLKTSLLYNSLGGQAAVSMLALDGISLSWVTDLDNLPEDSVVFVDAGPLLKFWGKMPQPLIYLALSDIALGKYSEARFALRTAMITSDTNMAFMYNESQLIFPPSEVENNCEAFLDFLERSSDENGDNRAIIETATELFDRCNFNKE